MYLGELRTDEQGRLIVLGGRGRSFSPKGVALTTFANNDGWTDDTSDGPVTARVRLGGVELPVDPAWVVVAPPNYGPALATDVGTLYDVIYQTMLDLGWVTPPAQVSFLADIFPFFDRLADLQWVNQGVLDRYGWDSPEQFMSPEYLARLADPSPANAAFRQALFARFRNPDYATLESRGRSAAAALRRRDHPPAGQPAELPRRAAVPVCGAPELGGGRLRPRRAPGRSRRSSRICRSRCRRRRSIAPRSRPASATPSIPAARRPGRCASPPCTPRRSGSCTARRPSPTTATS